MKTVQKERKQAVKLREPFIAYKSGTGQAMGTVVISSLAGGIGIVQQAGFTRVLIGTIGALLGWNVWAFMPYMIGTKLLAGPQTSAGQGELLRTIGFSSGPGLIRVFSFIPGIAYIVHLVASLWMLVAMVVAVRQALDYHSTFRALESA